ncbi:MAG: hypothetical protein HQM13_12245, partial [SAR324 cluster bacterium]|nr:hypothetical protein [SAR324 cluster bacterium]
MRARQDKIFRDEQRKNDRIYRNEHDQAVKQCGNYQNALNAILAGIITKTKDPKTGEEIQAIIKPKTASDVARLIEVQIKLAEYKMNLITRFGDPQIRFATEWLLGLKAEENWSARRAIEEFTRYGVDPPGFLIKQFSKELAAEDGELLEDNEKIESAADHGNAG